MVGGPMEFISTYGWAFLILLILIGALYYTGVLSNESLLPQYCNFDGILACQDFSASNSQGIFLLLSNVHDRPITLKQEHISISVRDGRDLNWGNCLINGEELVMLHPRGIAEIVCNEQLDAPPLETIYVDMNIQYITHSYPNPIKGQMRVRVEE